MHANVPQFIDVEDKIAGPLTWKQLFWMVGMLVVEIILYNIFEPAAFFAIGIPVGMIFCAFAFIKPYGQPLTTFVYFGLMHLAGPKVYVWKREVLNYAQPAKKQEIKKPKGAVSVMTLEEIESLAKTLDGRGR